jgi:AraC-like DNA-binding protein
MSARHQLAHALDTMTPQPGRNELAPGIIAVRDPHTTAVVPTIYTPALCLIAQGEKRIYLEDETYIYDESRILLFAIDLPIMAQVSRATPAEPYLGLRINLDPTRIAALVPKIFPTGVPTQPDSRGVYVADSDHAIVETATRLVSLFATPDTAPLLAPLIIEELMIRLLLSPIGHRVAQIGLQESHIQRISRAIDWIRTNYAQPMLVDDLATMVHMSNSAFHQHFKALTAMTPLQYQKVLRLQHARQLMLSANLDATHAAVTVGYASLSQFSREYRRLFGDAPVRDVARWRHGVNP